MISMTLALSVVTMLAAPPAAANAGAIAPAAATVSRASVSAAVADTTPPVSTSDAAASYAGTATIDLSATDEPGGSGIAALYYRIDGGHVTTVTPVVATMTITAPVVVTEFGLPHTLEFWSSDTAGNIESPHHLASFTIHKLSCSISITAEPTSVKLPRQFVLAGALSIAANGLPCVIYVKKPGKTYYSYSSARTTYGAGGSASNWWYRYTPTLRGTYSFYVAFPGDATYLTATSRTVRIGVR
jgi:hypothetical protein